MLRDAYIGAPPTVTLASVPADIPPMLSSFIVEQADSQLAPAMSSAAAAMFLMRIEILLCR
jgi:hypothetical protein